MLKELGLTIDAWEELPWWQQDVYIEGLNKLAKAQGRGKGRETPAATKLRDTAMWKRRSAGTGPSPARPPRSGGESRLADMGFDIA